MRFNPHMQRRGPAKSQNIEKIGIAHYWRGRMAEIQTHQGFGYQKVEGPRTVESLHRELPDHEIPIEKELSDRGRSQS